jgi:hypothetical protein
MTETQFLYIFMCVACLCAVSWWSGYYLGKAHGLLDSMKHRESIK